MKDEDAISLDSTKVCRGTEGWGCIAGSHVRSRQNRFDGQVQMCYAYVSISELKF